MSRMGPLVRPLTEQDALSEHDYRLSRPLSRMENRVHDLFVQTGWSNKRIAAELRISTGTVKVYMTHVMHAHQSPGRSDLIANSLWPKIRCLEADLQEATRLLGVYQAKEQAA